jgi:hypothetical protein
LLDGAVLSDYHEEALSPNPHYPNEATIELTEEEVSDLAFANPDEELWAQVPP